VSALPYVIFLAFASTSDRRFAGWAAFRQAIGAGRPLDEARFPPGARRPSDPGVAQLSSVGIWRLIASNNRELARSWVAYADFDAARAHVGHLQSNVDALEISVVRGDSASQYGWLASLHGVPVLMSGRWFGASSSSLQSAIATLADLGRATLAETPTSIGDAPTRAGRAPVVTW
jgi:hypothetical protein